MLLLKIVSGEAAGRDVPAGRFPFSIGRRKDADLATADAGLWEKHAIIELDPESGFQVKAASEASLVVNGSPVRQAPIRNGDHLCLGVLELTCWISPPKQRSLALAEGITWGLVGAAILLQVVVLSRLVLFSS